MMVSGFTIVRNAIKYNYPVIESINSILPLVDEFIIAVGDSQDDTLKLMQSIPSEKVKIIKTTWDFSMGKEVLSYQTNLALKECQGDWAFYLQTDEIIHEDDLPKIRAAMEQNLDNDVDALRFKWLHFYGSYYRYRIDHGWYQKQDRVIRNNGNVESFGDAWGFKRRDGKDLKRVNTGAFIYHYGWVHPDDVMASRRKNADQIGFISLNEQEKAQKFDYGDLSRFPVYFGSHPRTMLKTVGEHELSNCDYRKIAKKYWWYPQKVFKMRYKTFRRNKEKIT